MQNYTNINNYTDLRTMWYAAVGDNGFGIFNNTLSFQEAAQKLIWLEVRQFPAIEYAKAWAYSEYVRRYYFRNQMNSSPILPLNVLENGFFCDSTYAEREGGKNLPTPMPLLM